MHRRISPTARLAAAGAAALALAAVAPAAGAQESAASLEAAPKSVADLTGGGLASLGLGGLGSTVTGGDCVAIDPAFGSSTNTLNMEVATKEGASGIADVGVGVTGGGSSSTEDFVFHWRNRDTGASGEVEIPISTIGGGGYGGAEVATGAGMVEWSVDARQSAVPLSVGVALGALGSTADRVPGSSTPFTTCRGSAEID